MLLASWPCFCFKVVGLTICLADWLCFYFKAVDLTIGLAIDKTVLIALEIAVGLLK